VSAHATDTAGPTYPAAAGLISMILPLLRNIRRNPIKDMRDEQSKRRLPFGSRLCLTRSTILSTLRHHATAAHPIAEPNYNSGKRYSSGYHESWHTYLLIYVGLVRSAHYKDRV